MNDRNSHAVAEPMYYKDLLALSECESKFTYRKAHLKRAGYERKIFMRSVADALFASRKDGAGKAELDSLVEQMFHDGFRKEWFGFDVQYQNAFETGLFQFKRMAEYLSGYSVVSTKVTGKAGVELSCRGKNVSGISVTVPAVLYKDGQYVAVLFENKENPFSYKARKIANHPSRSVELCITYLALCETYGTNLRVESWYLKHRDDKVSYLAPEFESKPGKNVAGAGFKTRKLAMAYLLDGLAAAENSSCDCDSCTHKDVCQFSASVKTVPVEEVGSCTKMTKEPKFTEAQKKVVNFVKGAMCCIAVPGAGKTFSLAHRLARMIKSGISPDEILFVTFTRKAANELKTRVMSILGTNDEKEIPAVFTFNALGYSILLKNPILVGKRVRIADKTERFELLERALKTCPVIKNMSYEGAYLENGILNRLDELFEEIETEGEMEFVKYREKLDTEGILVVYREYKRLFETEGYISYDMQIELVNTLFHKYPNLKRKLAEQYRYIMVDEFQDTCEAQAQMIYSIAKEHGNIVVVGDDDQNIYAWRGGTNRFMLEFHRDFPNSELVFMNDNFRSNNSILKPAGELISRNTDERFDKKLIGHKDATFKPSYWKNTDASTVAFIVGKAIANGIKPGDIAVLARTNKRLEEVASRLSGTVRIASPKDYLRNDTVFLSLISVFRLYYSDMRDDVSLYRILKLYRATDFTRKCREKTLNEDLVSQRIFPVLDKMEPEGVEKFGMRKEESAYLLAAYSLMQCFKCILYGHGVKEVVTRITEILFSCTEHPVVEFLSNKAEECAFTKISELFHTMENMEKYSDETRIDYGYEDAVHLLTAHESKGKEFSMVIVYASEDFKDEPDENRLLYVAMTRAENTLFLLESKYSTCELLPYFEKSVSMAVR